MVVLIIIIYVYSPRDSPYPRAKPSVEMFDQLASIVVYM